MEKLVSANLATDRVEAILAVLVGAFNFGTFLVATETTLLVLVLISYLIYADDRVKINHVCSFNF